MNSGVCLPLAVTASFAAPAFASDRCCPGQPRFRLRLTATAADAFYRPSDLYFSGINLALFLSVSKTSTHFILFSEEKERSKPFSFKMSIRFS